MSNYLKVREAVRRYDISEKTLRNWIRKELLPTHPHMVNGVMQYGLLPEDIEKLIAEKHIVPGHMDTVSNSGETSLVQGLQTELSSQSEIIQALQQEITGLKTHIEKLEQRVDTLSRPVQPSTHTPRVTRSKQAQAPPDRSTLSARSFATMHGVTRDSMAGWIKRGEIEATEATYQRGKKQYLFTRDQQRSVIQFWQKNSIPYTACPDCPHK